MSQLFWRRRFKKVFNNIFLLHFEKSVTLHLKKNKTWIIFTHGCFVLSLVINGPVVLEKKILKSSQCIFAISQLSPLWEGRGPSFEQTKIPFTQECLVPSLVKVGPMVLEKHIFKSFQRVFTISQLSPLWERRGSSFEQTWIPFTQGCSVSSFVEIGQVVLEKKIFKSCQFIFIISELSPLWEGRGSSFKQILIPFTQEYILPNLVEIGPVVLEKKIWTSCQFIFIISQLSPLWERCGPLFEQTWILFTQGYLVPFLAQWFWWRRWKCEQFTDGRTDTRTDRQTTDAGDQRAHLSFQLRWATKQKTKKRAFKLLTFRKMF